MILAGCGDGRSLEFHNHLHLDRRVAGKARHANGGARVLASLAEHFTIRSENPLTTSGWSPKPSAESQALWPGRRRGSGLAGGVWEFENGDKFYARGDQVTESTTNPDGSITATSHPAEPH